jgi:hypothetical protein
MAFLPLVSKRPYEIHQLVTSIKEMLRIYKLINKYQTFFSLASISLSNIAKGFIEL